MVLKKNPDERKKRYSFGFAISGLILLVVGIGLIVWIIGFVEYICRNDEIVYITKSDAYENDIEEASASSYLYAVGKNKN